MTDSEEIQEYEVLDTVLKYLIDNRTDNPIHCEKIWKDVYPEIKKGFLYFTLKKLIGNDIVTTVVREIDIEDFSVFFGANDITDFFLSNKGGFTAMHKRDQADKIEQNRLDKLQTEKLEAEVDIIKFQKGLGKKLTIWGFVIAALSVLASVGTTLVQTRHDDNFDPRIDSLTHRVDSLTDSFQKTRQQLQSLELQLSKDTLTSN
jgi:hypothetical protein